MVAQASLGDFSIGSDEELTDAERDAYEAVERGRYGVREYARRTGRSPGTVGNLLARARAKIGRAD